MCGEILNLRAFVNRHKSSWMQGNPRERERAEGKISEQASVCVLVCVLMSRHGAAVGCVCR